MESLSDGDDRAARGPNSVIGGVLLDRRRAEFLISVEHADDGVDERDSGRQS